MSSQTKRIAIQSSQIEAIDRERFNAAYDRVYFRRTRRSELIWLFRHEVKILRGQ